MQVHQLAPMAKFHLRLAQEFGSTRKIRACAFRLLDTHGIEASSLNATCWSGVGLEQVVKRCLARSGTRMM
jgi:hypothetical protein